MLWLWFAGFSSRRLLLGWSLGSQSAGSGVCGSRAPDCGLRSLRIPGSRLQAQEFADPELPSAGSGVCGSQAPECGLRSLRIPGSRLRAQEFADPGLQSAGSGVCGSRAPECGLRSCCPGSSWTSDLFGVFCIARRIPHHCTTRETLIIAFYCDCSLCNPLCFMQLTFLF